MWALARLTRAELNGTPAPSWNPGPDEVAGNFLSIDGIPVDVSCPAPCSGKTLKAMVQE